MIMNGNRAMWRRGLLLLLVAAIFWGGCGGCTTMKKWVGLEKGEDEEELAPPEAKEETVMIDGKPYVRSKNPYWLTYPNVPEYIYVEKGKEFVGMQQYMISAFAKAVGKEQAKMAGKAVPPEKVQELVRQEVERILREQGLAGFVSKGRGEQAPYSGRAVAVIPDLDTPTSQEGLNRTLAMSLAEALRRQKDITVSGDDQVRAAMSKAGVTGKVALPPNLRALGDYLGVQGIVLTGVLPPEKGAAGVMMLVIYDTFMGNKVQTVVAPAETGALKPETVGKFARDNALRVAGEMVNMEWFGRVEFIKENKVYLSLGQNAGLKVGDRLKVVTPGKEVINPRTQVVLGYTADTSQGELKVTELLGNSGAVALSVSGGPFKPNDKIKAR
ncbi:MAG: hypothetical protein Q8M54_12265 [Desulfobaccales bacterium]|nr:hypothetical protein [Desulfobaccales bacterium]